MKVLYGAYEPDRADHLTDTLTIADNVIPSPNGYRPVKAFSAITDALASTFLGGATLVASDGTVNLLAGTPANLYRYTSSLAWTSIISGLSAERWYFTQFGDVAVATNGGTPIAVDLLAGTAASLGGSPPTAKLCTTVRNFVVLGQADGEENLVRWSGFENETEWTNGTNQAGEQPMLTGGAITGLAGGEYGLVFQRSRITRMTYVGTPLIWQFDEISANIGCLTPGSIAQAGRMVFFYSDRGFMMTDGNDVKPIGAERIDRAFADSYSALDLAAMYSTVDPKNHLVFWSMPGKLWIYNWQLDRWTTSTWAVQAILSGFTAGVSLDALDALYPDLDAMDVSLDDPRFQGGTPLLLAVNTSNTVGTLTGDTLKATLQQPYIELVEGRVARVNKVRPITDATSGLSIEFRCKARLGDIESAQSFGDLQDSGTIDCRISGRYIRPTTHVTAGANWDFLQGLEFNAVAAGGRR